MFEYDSAKSTANKAKHGIDFEEAQALWNDDRRVEAQSTSSVGEERWLVIGRGPDGKLWTAIVTYRDSIRIISVRRARDYEVREYERQG